MKKQLSLAVVSLLGIAPLSFAAGMGGDSSNAVIRQQHKANQVKLSGSLSCKTTEKNSGEPCTLSIEDRASGKVFKLVGSSDAMRLYHGGKRTVAVEGTLTEFDTVSVASVNVD